MPNDFALIFYFDGTERPDESGCPTIRGFCGQRKQVLDCVKGKPAVWDWAVDGAPPSMGEWIEILRSRKLEAVR